MNCRTPAVRLIWGRRRELPRVTAVVPPAARTRAAGGSRVPKLAITLSEGDGVRYLHFGTEWVQGAMRIARPYALELEYQQQMMAVGLLQPQPRHIVQLGLGAGSLAKFCWRYCAPAQVTAVELAPAVVEACRSWFRLPPDDERLRVEIADAREFVADRRQHAADGLQADWLQVDLYDSAARGPVYDDVPFYRACRRALAAHGGASFNLFGRRFGPSAEAIATAFDGQWLALPATVAGNRVVLAWSDPHAVRSLAQVKASAAELAQRWRLPVTNWLDALRWPI